MRAVSALLATILATAGGVQLTVAQTPPSINGWYPCSPSAPGVVAANVTSPVFECATVEVPLCHAGICQSEKKIDLFVRRLLADPTKIPDVRKALWVLQGGPGGSSTAMEGHMITLATLLEMKVDLYTMDHRGTGRSFFLDCKAAQAFTAGSPAGVNPNYEELPNCVADILHQIENKTEAFSVTSAAKDVEYLTANLYPADVHTYIYGVSYGSYFTERIMHLAPKNVRGYILDGVVPEDNPSFTTTTVDRVPPAERLAKACEKDAFCSSKFGNEATQPGGLHAAWLALYDTLDKAAPGSNKCAEALRGANPTVPPSYTLRNQLGDYGAEIGKRVAIPAFYYRVRRCNAGDVALLKSVFSVADVSADGSVQPLSPASYDQVGEDSPFLGSIIKSSEMWTVPSPSWEDELKEYKKGLLPNDMSPLFGWYCFFSASFSDPACTDLKATNPTIDFSKLNTPKFLYKPDQYWHQFAAIPSQASVLIVNGKLDFQTVSDGGVREYENLKGDAAQKMMVEFEFGGHGAGISPSTYSDDTLCGYKIIASFVAVDGKTGAVDTKCLSTVPPFDFKDLSALQTLVPDLKKAEDFYDADLTALLSGESKGSSDDQDAKKLRHIQHLRLRFEKAQAAVEAGQKEANGGDDERDNEDAHRHKHVHIKVRSAATTAEVDDVGRHKHHHQTLNYPHAKVKLSKTQA